jgi:hypothetical protein
MPCSPRSPDWIGGGQTRKPRILTSPGCAAPVRAAFRLGLICTLFLLFALLATSCAAPAQPAATEAPAPAKTEAPLPAAATSAAAEKPSEPLPTQAPSRPSATPPPPARPTVIPAQPTIVPAQGEAHIVQVEWPVQMRLGDSDIVRLALVPASQGYLLVTEYEEHETVTQTVPIERPPGYELFASARLDGPGFAISPAGEQAQYLALDRGAQWRWSLTPQSPGSHRLAVALTLRWIPTMGKAGPVREVTAYSRGLDVRVISFLGLTQSQAALTGVFTLLLGGGLGAFAVATRPRPGQRRFKIQDLAPDPGLAIELPAGMQLNPAEKALMQTLFRHYGRLMIEREFLSGYSGARALLALPIRPDGRADAYTIAKIGARPAIEQEFANYEAFVKDTLPPVTARIQHAPVSTRAAGTQGLAALRYTFIGEPGKPPLSLRQALLEKPDPALLSRLLELFGPNWWLQRRPYNFHLALEYDRVLPTHLVLEPAEGKGALLDGHTAPSRLDFRPGDVLTLRHFPYVELRPDGRSLSLQGEPPAGHPPLRLRWLSTQRPEGATGRVVSTRRTLLGGFVQDFDRFGLPDPLACLPAWLEETIQGSQSTIHGDLNLENILLGPGGMLWLIDFASTRDGHALFDFAHLSAEIIAHILAPQIEAPADFVALLHNPQASPYAHLYPLLEALQQIAARCLFNPDRPAEFNRALALACLGALKYTNLDRHARHLLYLMAAEKAGEGT